MQLSHHTGHLDGTEPLTNSLAAVLHLNLSPASVLKAQDAASDDPVICAHHTGPGRRKRQPSLAVSMRQGHQSLFWK